METSKVLIDLKGEIAIITINRPEKANAINNEVWQRLRDAIKKPDFKGI